MKRIRDENKRSFLRGRAQLWTNSKDSQKVADDERDGTSSKDHQNSEFPEEKRQKNSLETILASEDQVILDKMNDLLNTSDDGVVDLTQGMSSEKSVVPKDEEIIVLDSDPDTCMDDFKDTDVSYSKVVEQEPMETDEVDPKKSIADILEALTNSEFDQLSFLESSSETQTTPKSFHSSANENPQSSSKPLTDSKSFDNFKKPTTKPSKSSKSKQTTKAPLSENKCRKNIDLLTAEYARLSEMEFDEDKYDEDDFLAHTERLDKIYQKILDLKEQLNDGNSSKIKVRKSLKKKLLKGEELTMDELKKEFKDFSEKERKQKLTFLLDLESTEPLIVDDELKRKLRENDRARRESYEAYKNGLLSRAKQ